MLSFSLIALSCLLTGTTALSASERTAVLNAHNNFRSQLATGKAVDKNNNPMPKGKNIYQLTYSASLETSAQNWANGCVFEHSGSNGKGENLYAYFSNQAITQALTDASNLWWAELAENGSSASLLFTMDVFNSGVGHWSQMAWGNTIEIGCGVTWCSKASSPMTIVVCQYSPPGNFIGSNIYEAGNPCTANADCTTTANSFCNASLGMCSATAVASSTASNSTGSSAAASNTRTTAGRAATTTAREATTIRQATTTRRRRG